MSRHPKMSLIFVGSICILFGFLAPLSIFAATNIYYAVGQNTTDHKTGSPTVTISGNTATFSVAQTATNMGIGDKVTWGNTGVGFITGKTSTSIWSISTATGGTPTATTTAPVNSIAHAFASLNAAVGTGVAGNATSTNFLNTSDLVSGDYVLNIPVYFDSGADASGVTMNGFTTSASNYVRIYTATSTTSQVNTNQRHSGVFSTSKYYLTSALVASSSAQFLKFDGLQFRTTSASANNNIRLYSTGGGVIEFTNNIVKGVLTGASSGYGILLTTSMSTSTLKAYNNLFLGWVNSSVSSAAFRVNNLWDVYIYNNTVYNSTIGISRVNGNIIAKNNLFASTTQPASGTFVNGTDYNATASSTIGYTVTGGGNTHDRVSQTFSFIDALNDNFHLAAGDLGALNFGVNLSADATSSFAVDFDNDVRPSGASWDIGSDERDIVAPIISSIASSTLYTTATVTWNTDEFATSTIEYGLTDSYGTASSSALSVTSHTANLTGLSAGTTYHFRVSSGDAAYNYATSSDYTFTTLPLDVIAPITSSVATSTNALFSTITWTTDEAASSTIQFGTTTSYGYASSSSAFVTSHSITLNDLQGYSNYHFRIIAQDVSNNTSTTSDYLISMPAPICGNNITEPGEACDGSDINNLTCSSYVAGYASGSLSCASSCLSYVTSSCVPGNVVNAASCSMTDVNTAVSSASDGDEVLIPAGSCTWTLSTTTTAVGLSISNKNLLIKGAGIGVTTITQFIPWPGYAVSTSSTMRLIEVDNTTSSKPIRVTNLSIGGEGYLALVDFGGSKNFRFDHIGFESSPTLNDTRSLFVDGYTYGLVDNLQINKNEVEGRGTIMSRTEDTTASLTANVGWQRPLTLGTKEAVYIEDSDFVSTATAGNFIVDNENSGRTVFRYNDVTNSEYGTHGLQSSQGRGVRSWEVYNNNFTKTQSAFVERIWMRGGTGVIYNNTFADTGAGASNAGGGNYIAFDNPRDHTLYNPFGYCDGTSAWDGNQVGLIGYPCADQIGRSTGHPTDQKLVPAYEWNNLLSGADVDVAVINGATSTVHIVEGRDYFNDTQMPGYVAYPYPHPLSLIEPFKPALTTSAASSIAQTSATLNGNITFIGDTSPTVRGIAYGTSATLATVIATTTENGSFSAGAYTAAASSLTCNTTYYSRAYATNSTGTGYGSIISFTTSACAGAATTSSGSSTRLRRAEEEALAQAQSLALATASLSTTTSTTTAAVVFTSSPVTTQTPSLTPTLSQFIDLLISLGVISPDRADQARLIASTPSTPTYSFTRDLQFRDTGTDVRNLQSFLVSKGFLTATPNGIFGPQTLSALRSYQSSEGIPSTGYFGPLTRGSVR